MKYRILVVDDDKANLRATEALLEEWDFRVDVAQNGKEGIQKLKEADREYAVVLLDYKMPEINGAQTAVQMRAINSETIIIVYSCDASREALKETLRAGVIDFIDKAENVEVLRSALELGCQRYEESIQLFKPIVNKAYNAELLQSIAMVGHSQKMADVAQKCLRYREHDAPVLILGETGTGKELVARAISTGGPDLFFPINCAAFGDGSLVESELFGYEKGAFTGASERKIGILEAAGEGTVFLDELHHLSLKVQATLLRAVREKKIRRVGATKEIAIKCRILAATKPDLLKRVEQGSFLADLYYRLKFLTIDLPALRERPEDIGLLVDHFSKNLQKSTNKRFLFRARTIRILEKYSWPGNVGELEGCINHLLINAKNSIIGPSELDHRFRPLEILESPKSTLADLESKHRSELKDLIKSALHLAGSTRRAATRLGVNESSLRGMIERLQLK